ncbi:hypothetical protein K3495_g9690 [Podosphaera aphanis]|nr:hypothetical protein K3495_g9690 [Podosphaera aphanis]
MTRIQIQKEIMFSVQRAARANEREIRERNALRVARAGIATMRPKIGSGTQDVNQKYRDSSNKNQSAQGKRKGCTKLRTIVGREEKGPLDYKKMFNDTMVIMSMMDFYQASPDFAKCSQIYSMRINEKRVKKKRAPIQVTVEDEEEILMLEKTSSSTRAKNMQSRRDKSHPVICNSTMAKQLPEVNLISKVAIKTTERKDRAFPIPGEVLLSRNGKPGRIYLDNSMVCADQGLDLVLISPQSVRVLELEKYTLSSPQNQVITMGTTDGASHRITEWVSYVFGSGEINRQVHAFIQPDKGVTNDLFLLLGLP